MLGVVSKIIHLPITLRIKFSPIYNRWLFKSKNIRIGHNFNVIGNVSVVGPGKITIGDDFYMTSGLHINPISANMEGSFFTDSVNAEINIGNNVGMSSTRMWIHNKLIIGNHVDIGACVLFIDTDTHSFDHYERRLKNDENAKSTPIIIEDDVWIGAHCNILKGVTIGSRSIIGAGSIVTKSIPADCIAAGNPCKIIRHLDNKQKR